jgi:ferrous iron transport protein A
VVLGARSASVVRYFLKVTFKIRRRRGGGPGGPEPRTLGELPRGARAVVDTVGGERPFRRRLMEMGLTPGTAISLVNVAPLGDPLEIELRSGRLSIRRHEAAMVLVRR